MFKRATTPKFWSTVKAEFLDEDGNKRTLQFDVQFKRLPVDEIRKLTRENEGAEAADLLFMEAVVVGWRGVEDDDGTPAEFTLENLKQLYESGFGGAVVTTYFRSLPRAKEKN